MNSPASGNQISYSKLSGEWTYALTYPLKDATLFDVRAAWSGKIRRAVRAAP